MHDAYAGNHLQANLPKLPPKRLRLLQDHSSEAFLQERREGLEAYLRKLLALPGTTHKLAFRRFLELDAEE